MSLLDDIKIQLAGGKKAASIKGPMSLGNRIKAAIPSTPAGRVEDRRGQAPVLQPKPMIKAVIAKGPKMPERAPGSYRQQPGYPSQIQPPDGKIWKPVEDDDDNWFRVPNFNRGKRR